MLKEISAGIIVYRKTSEGPKFLILYHGRGYWNFPKGKIENDIQENVEGVLRGKEKSFQAAVRETKEETGLSRNDLKFNQLFNKSSNFELEDKKQDQSNKYFKVYEKFVFWKKSGNKIEKIFKIVILYLAETKKIDICLSNEHSGYGWFTYKEAIKILSKYKDSQKILRQAYEALGGSKA